MAKRWKSTDPYPSGATFGELLDWHLTVWGTNPKSTSSERGYPWILRNFAELVHSGLPPTEEENNPERKLWNWRHGVHLPREGRIERNIFNALFGGEPELADWESDLQDALDQERGEKKQRQSVQNEPAKLVACGVPRPTAHFLGRDDECGALVAALLSPEGTAALLVQGGPGMGKTELTKAVAHHPDVSAHFGERRWFIRLETASTAEAMQDTIIRAIGCEPQYGFQAALDMLRAKPSLLILDNLETPWESAEEQGAIEEVLAKLGLVSNLALLASMRGVETLKQPKWLPHRLQVLRPDHAEELFVALAGYGIQADPDLPELLNALAGLPLAIDLVARRAHGRNDLTSILQEWSNRRTDFAKLNGKPESSLTSLSHSIAISLATPRVTNDPYALRLFGLLGRLPNGITKEYCYGLFNGEAYDSEETLFRAGLSVERGEKIDLLPPLREYSVKNVPIYKSDIIDLANFYVDAISLNAVHSSANKEYEIIQNIFYDIENIISIFEEVLIVGEYSIVLKALDHIARLPDVRRFFIEIVQDVMRQCGDSRDYYGEINAALFLAEEGFLYPEKSYSGFLLERCLRIIEISGDRTQEEKVKSLLSKI